MRLVAVDIIDQSRGTRLLIMKNREFCVPRIHFLKHNLHAEDVFPLRATSVTSCIYIVSFFFFLHIYLKLRRRTREIGREIREIYSNRWSYTLDGYRYRLY